MSRTSARLAGRKRAAHEENEANEFLREAVPDKEPFTLAFTAPGAAAAAEQFSLTVTLAKQHNCCICLERLDEQRPEFFEIRNLCCGHAPFPLEKSADPWSPEDVLAVFTSTYGVRDEEENDYDCKSFLHAMALWSSATKEWLDDRGLPPFSISFIQNLLRRVCKPCFLSSLRARLDSSGSFVTEGQAASRPYVGSNAQLISIVCPVCVPDVANDYKPYVLNTPNLLALLDQNDATRVVAALDSAYVRRTQPFVHCPHNDCRHVQIRDCNTKAVECAQHGRTCVRCLAPMRSRTHRCSRAPDGVVGWDGLAGLRQCPQCRTPIEKDGGCDSMRCATCGSRFQWNLAPVE